MIKALSSFLRSFFAALPIFLVLAVASSGVPILSPICGIVCLVEFAGELTLVGAVLCGFIVGRLWRIASLRGHRGFEHRCLVPHIRRILDDARVAAYYFERFPCFFGTCFLAWAFVALMCLCYPEGD